MSANPSHADALDALARATATHEGEHCYWLIDPVLADPCAEVFAQWAEAKRTIATVTHSGACRSLSPYLLTGPAPGVAREHFIQAGAAQAAEESLARPDAGAARPRSVCALFITNIAGQTLASAISRASIVFTHDEQRRIFRFWDPRVLPALSAHAELRRLLPGGIDGMCWLVDAFGQVRQFDTRHWGPDATAPDAPRRLTQAQSVWLARLGEANRVIERLHVQHVPEAHDTSMDRAMAAVAAAHALGLTKMDDCIAFAAQRVASRAPIELAPDIRALLSATLTGGLPYAALQNEIPADAWPQIATEALRLEAAEHRHDALSEPT